MRGQGAKMKKLLSLFLALFMVSGCFDSSENTFKGKLYKYTSSPENMAITLGFDAQEPRFYGKALNNYMGSYKQEGEEIIFSQVATTMMAGPQEMMQAESDYLAALPKVNSFKLDGKKLILKTSDGKELIYEEQPKEENSEQE